MTLAVALAVGVYLYVTTSRQNEQIVVLDGELARIENATLDNREAISKKSAELQRLRADISAASFANQQASIQAATIPLATKQLKEHIEREMQPNQRLKVALAELEATRSVFDSATAKIPSELPHAKEVVNSFVAKRLDTLTKEAADQELSNKLERYRQFEKLVDSSITKASKIALEGLGNSNPRLIAARLEGEVWPDVERGMAELPLLPSKYLKFMLAFRKQWGARINELKLIIQLCKTSPRTLTTQLSEFEAEQDKLKWEFNTCKRHTNEAWRELGNRSPWSD